MKKFITLGLLTLAWPMNAQDSGSYLALRQAFRNSDDGIVQKYLDNELASQPENEVLLEEAVLSAVYNLDLDLAEEYANQLRTLAPDSMAVDVADFSLAVKQGEWGKAEDILNSSENLKFISPDVIHAWNLVSQDKADEAIAFLEKTAEAQGELGFIFDFQRAMVEAYAHQNYQTAVDIIANNGETIYLTDLSFYSHLALLKLADSPAFTPFMEAQFGARDGWPGFVETLVQKAEKGEIDPALDFYSPQNAVGEYILALTSNTANRRLDIGVERLLQGIVPSIAPENGWFMHGYMSYFYSVGSADERFGDTLQAEGEFEDVLRFSEQISPKSFVYDPSQQTRVNALFELDRDDEAREWADDLKTKAPDQLAFRADVYRRVEEYQKAIENYEASLEITGIDQERLVWPIYGLAISFERLDEWDKAEPMFLQALKLDPNNADILNYLGYSYVDRGLKLDEGLEMIEKAVELAPNQGHIIDSLGWAYYRLERFDEAIEPLETASTILASDAIVNSHLGDLYWQLGRKREARYQWERSLHFLKEDSVDLTQAELQERIANGL